MLCTDKLGINCLTVSKVTICIHTLNKYWLQIFCVDFSEIRFRIVPLSLLFHTVGFIPFAFFKVRCKALC